METDRLDKTDEEQQAYRKEAMGKLWPELKEEGSEHEEMTDSTQESHTDLTDESGDSAGADATVAAESSVTIESLAKKVADLEQLDFRIKQAERRLGSLQNVIQNAPAKTTPLKATGPTEEEVKAAAESTQKRKELIEEYPEFKQPLERVFTEIDALRNRESGAFEKRLEEERTKLQTDFNQRLNDIQIATEKKFIAQAYPNWEQIDESAEFKSWLSKQTDELRQRAAVSSDALEVIGILDKYHDDTKPPVKHDTAQDINRRRQTQRDRSAPSHKPTRQSHHSKTPDDMTDAEYRAAAKRKFWGK